MPGVTVWDELKVVLVRLSEGQPSVCRVRAYWVPLLVRSCSRILWGTRCRKWTRAGCRRSGSTWRLGLSRRPRNCTASSGDDVELRVGALPYPPGLGAAVSQPVTTLPLPDLLDSREITVELDGPAVVRSGHTLRHSLLVRNLPARDLQIATNGQVTAAVVDPQTGEVVGGFSGWQTAPLVIFRVAAGATERPAADRHGQLYAPAWLCGPSRRMGNPGNAHTRPAPPRLTQQAHTDPAPHNHRLNQATRSRLAQGRRPALANSGCPTAGACRCRWLKGGQLPRVGPID